MRLIVGGKDISELLENLTWSGDTKQVTRKISFTIAQNDIDKYLPKVTIAEGDSVTLQEGNGGQLFYGIIFDIEKSAASNLVTYLGFDLMFYINNSQISKVFEATPEAITSQICSELGVPFGSAAPTGFKLYLPVLGKEAYQAIMMAYTAASKQNGKKYMPQMQGDKVCVIERGKPCGVTLNGDENLTDASYKTTLQGLVNKILITDKGGGVVSTVQDAASLKYGIVQKVIQSEDDKDMSAEAKALLKAIEQTASVNALSDTRAVSGFSIMIKEPVTGLNGVFYIESDSHTFSNGKAEMQLTLEFKNMMDEHEIELPDNGSRD